MTVLVTGAAGLFGSHIAESLVARGLMVVGVDDFSRGTRRNLEVIRREPNFTFVESPISEISHVFDKMGPFTDLFHFAAHKIPRYGGALDTLRVNGMESAQLLELAIQRGARVISASTSDVYGMSSDLPFAESGNLVVGPPTVKRWSYAISKMFNEQWLEALSDQYSIPAASLRLFGTYGPRESTTWHGGPVPVFINQAIAGRPLSIHGDGRQKRTFAYIEDQIAALMRVFDTNWVGHQVLNLGSNSEVSLLQLATLVWRLVWPEAGTVPTEFTPYSQFGPYQDVTRRVPDLSATERMIGLPPQTPLEKGLATTVAWHRAIDPET